MTSHILFTSNSAWSLWLFSKTAILDCLDRGHRVTLLAPWDETATDLEALGCTFVHLNYKRRGVALLHDLLLLFQFYRIFGQNQPDIVYTSTIKCNVFGVLVAKFLKIPVVPTITRSGWALDTGGLTQRIVQWLYKIALSNLPTILFLHENARRAFVDRDLIINEENTMTLPSASVDLDEFIPHTLEESGEEPIFLMIGRLIRDKGLLDYIRAARLVRMSYPKAHFQLLGRHVPDHPNAVDEEMITLWEKQGLVEYLGVTKDPRPFMDKASCIVLPSHKESAPRVLIEAAAMARPVIASNLEECAAIVKDRSTGFLYEAKSSSGLAEACETFIYLSQFEREAMGKAARSRVEKCYRQDIMKNAYRVAADRTLVDTS